MDIETRVTNLENMLASIMKNMSNQKFYTDADIAGCRHTEGELGTKNTEQDGGISENSDAVIDVAALSDENSTAITDLGDYAGSLDERITELEGRING